MIALPFHELTRFEVCCHGLVVLVFEGERVAVRQPGGTEDPEKKKNISCYLLEVIDNSLVF